MNWFDSLFGIARAIAETAADPAATEEVSAGMQALSLVVSLLPMVLIFVVFYFFLIRPQRKKDKQVKEMLDNLKTGDRVCTIGGIYGTIVRIKDQVLTIEVGEQKTQMMIARWAVRNVEQLSVTNDAETLI